MYFLNYYDMHITYFQFLSNFVLMNIIYYIYILTGGFNLILIFSFDAGIGGLGVKLLL